MATYDEPTQPRQYADWHSSLPNEFPDSGLLERIRARNERAGAKVVVLDDDPTGPQAISDVYVLTDWSVDALSRELAQPRPLFFVLTNTRSMPAERAVLLHAEVAANLREAARATGCTFDLVSRGDSTLRGHYPAEVDALGEFDGTIIAPFFLEGGRFTTGDVQWVRENDLMVPAALTPYARDHAFGYSHSNLRNWVEEKTGGRIPADEVLSIPLDAVRTGGPVAVARLLLGSRGQTIIVNSASYRDMEVFVCGLLDAEERGMRFVCRTAASFVRVRAGQGEPSSDWKPEGQSKRGGLVIVGSHVPKTSAQLAAALSGVAARAIELSVPAIAGGEGEAEADRVERVVSDALRNGETAIVYTTREVQDRPAGESLAIGAQITGALISIVRRLHEAPSFMIAKGGWTASEIGTRALNARRAYAPAPIIPGVPMWVLGPETRFPGMPYVIFPGNVGGDDALLSVIRHLTGR